MQRVRADGSERLGAADSTIRDLDVNNNMASRSKNGPG